MTGVFFGPIGLDLTPIVHEAVDELGYFRTDALPALVDQFDREWPHGISSTMLIYGKTVGEDLTAEEKAAAGLTKARMPRGVWELLSATGKADPRGAIEAVTIRTILGVQRQRDLHRGAPR